MITMRSVTRATLLLAVAALTAQAQVGASVTAKDANSLPEAEIAALPGMGPRMIREFLEYRPYKDLAVFRREMGKYVKPDEVARLEQYVFVPMDPTTASDADLMTIPGMGPRMVREFKEYRPWTSRAQFDKEIGKYVNAKEVARLAGFLTFPK